MCIRDSPNAGGLFGLLQGVRFVSNKGVSRIAMEEKQLADQLVAELRKLESVDGYCWDCEQRTGVVSFNIKQQDPATVAMLLDSEFGIQVRAGLHCAPLIHKSLGTDMTGGTIRVSPGVFNTAEHIDRLVQAVAQLTSQLV